MIYQRESIEGPLEAILETLSSVCGKYGKAYCYPSQETILRLASTYHGVEMSRRTLNRVLRWLEDHKYFKRTKRHRQGPDGRILFATTMFELKKKLFIRLNSLKKWLDWVSAPLRVPLRAPYRSHRKNAILLERFLPVEMLWKTLQKVFHIIHPSGFCPVFGFG